MAQEHGIGQTGNVSVLFWVCFSGRVVCCRHAAADIVVAASRQKGGVGFTTIVAVNVTKLSRISCVAATWAREKGFALHAFGGSVVSAGRITRLGCGYGGLAAECASYSGGDDGARSSTAAAIARLARFLHPLFLFSSGISLISLLFYPCSNRAPALAPCKILGGRIPGFSEDDE